MRDEPSEAAELDEEKSGEPIICPVCGAIAVALSAPSLAFALVGAVDIEVKASCVVFPQNAR